MDIRIANRISKVKEYYFFKKLKEIEEMNTKGPRKVINLGIGSPDLPPSKKVTDTLAKSAYNPHNHAYQSYKGIPGLRKAFAKWYKLYYGVNLNPDNEILPLMGSKEGIMHISMTYIDKGDKVLIPDPGYPAYETAARLAGGDIVHYSLEESKNWLPDLDKLSKINFSKVKLMWVNYPNMPTGEIASRAFFKELICFGEENNILICNDNPYSFIQTEKPKSILETGGAMNVAIELNSLSKSHRMAGWRMGMVAGKADWINNILKFKSNMDSGMFLPMQHAAISALNLDKNWYVKNNLSYYKRKVKVWEILDHLKCSYNKNQAGIFVWAKIPKSVQDAATLTDFILYNARVFITPGIIFGSKGKRHIRISLCNSINRIEKAFERIKKVTL